MHLLEKHRVLMYLLLIRTLEELQQVPSCPMPAMTIWVFTYSLSTSEKDYFLLLIILERGLKSSTESSFVQFFLLRLEILVLYHTFIHINMCYKYHLCTEYFRDDFGENKSKMEGLVPMHITRYKSTQTSLWLNGELSQENSSLSM